MNIITNPAQMVVWENRLRNEPFAFDFETLEIKYGEPITVLGVSFATNSDSCYLPLRGKKVDVGAGTKLLKSVMKSKQMKVAHMLQFETAVCWQLGIDVRWPWGDSMVAAFNHNCARFKYGLKEVCTYYGIEPAVDFDELTKEKSMEEFSIEEMAKYSIPHSENTLELHNRIEKCLKASGGWSSYYDIDMPCLPSVVWLEKNGVEVDVEQAEKLSSWMRSQEEALEQEAADLVGRKFSLAPSNDLRDTLFKQLRLPVNKLTGKTQIPCVDEESLRRLDHPVVDIILKYREIQKMRSTFIDAIPKFAINGRMYPRLHMTSARSGRFSSSNPNEQNIPTDETYGVRNLFIAADGNKLSVADYSQIEMRLAAVLSGDKQLLDVYKNNLDIHAKTAQMLFGKVDKKTRSDGKTINFAVSYGQGPAALASTLKISKSKAQEYLNNYWKLYSGLASYNRYLINSARLTGYTKTVGGRQRALYQINSSDGFRRSMDERIATNHPVQGTAAEVLKIAQTKLYERFGNTEAKLVLSVHDELVLDAPADIIEDVSREQVKIMSELGERIKFEIPLSVNCKIGNNWGECK